jgi:polysaccharide biosynthesis/export protein
MERANSLIHRASRLLCAAFLLQLTAHAQPEYTVGPRDVLSVTVWSQADLSGKYTVGPDGTFTFPLIGEVKAHGLTLAQVESELRRRLADGFFVQPQLSVAIDEYRSQRIFVVGQVRQPGTYPLTGSMTLIEAIAKAGSTTSDAASEVVIVRAAGSAGPVLPNQANGSEVIRVDLDDLQTGSGTPVVRLGDGDTIFVPRAEQVFVSGQVRTPGAYPIGKKTTVLQVVSLAGGLTERAASNRIKVVRLTAGGDKQEVRMKLGDIVQAGDTLIVPERFF